MDRNDEDWLKTVEEGAPLLWEAAMKMPSGRADPLDYIPDLDTSKMDREQLRAYLMEKHRAPGAYNSRRADG
jgi:hypothetical protein